MWNVTLRLSTAFAHIAARDTSSEEVREVYDSWFMPHKPLPQALREFFATNNIESIKNFVINTRMGEHILERNLMNQCAFLTTAGFENWPHMNLPVQSRFFSLYPKRTASPLTSDLIFGLAEQMDVEGNVISALELESLDYLIPKLNLNQIKDVAVGFVNSNRNPEHEELCTKHLKEKGFNVFPSFHCSTVDGIQFSELSRWWAAIINASLHMPMQEAFTDLQELLHPLLKDNVLKFQTSNRQIENYDSPSYLSTCLAHHGLIAETLKSLAGDENIVYVHFGLEEFMAYPNQPQDSRWLTQIGPVLHPHSPYKPLKIQPTQVIEKNIWGTAGFKYSSRAAYAQTFAKSIGFEPGPICFGRGLKPTFIDIASIIKDLGAIEDYKKLLGKNRKPLILENLLAASKDARKKEAFADHQIVEWLYEQAIHQIFLDLSSLSQQGKNKLVLSGPLLPLVKDELSQHIEFSTVECLDKNISSYFLNLVEEI